MSDQNGLLDMPGAQGDGLPFSPHGLHVLAVDDDKLCLKVIAKMLQQCHYEGAPMLLSPLLQYKVASSAAEERSSSVHLHGIVTNHESLSGPHADGMNAHASSL